MKFYLISFIIIFCFFAVFGNLAYSSSFEESSGLRKSGEKTGHTELPVTKDNLPGTIGMFVNIFLSFLGVIFFVLMVYGGFTWMTAAGNEEGVAKAKKIIINSIIGLVVLLSAYAVTMLAKSFVESDQTCPSNTVPICDDDGNCECQALPI